MFFAGLLHKALLTLFGAYILSMIGSIWYKVTDYFKGKTYVSDDSEISSINEVQPYDENNKLNFIDKVKMFFSASDVKTDNHADLLSKCTTCITNICSACKVSNISLQKKFGPYTSSVEKHLTALNNEEDAKVIIALFNELCSGYVDLNNVDTKNFDNVKKSSREGIQKKIEAYNTHMKNIKKRKEQK